MAYKNWRQLLLCMLATLLSSQVSVPHRCLTKNVENAGAIDPEEAYQFGIKIQEIVAKENLQALFSLVHGELSLGPRKRYICNKSFSEVFSKSWKDDVLAKEPERQPVGWRGFMLGHGSIWYQNSGDGNWEIFAINGAKEEPKVGGGWTMNKQLLSPYYFGEETSRDCYKEFFEAYLIEGQWYDFRYKFDDFFQNIGNYLGKEIPIKTQLTPSWGGKPIALVTVLENTSSHTATFFIQEDGSVAIMDADGDYVESYYEVIENIPPAFSQALAPNIQGSCQELKLVKAGFDGGGTIGPTLELCIYGLFEVENELLLVPLRNFDNLGHARNFVDDLKATH